MALDSIENQTKTIQKNYSCYPSTWLYDWKKFFRSFKQSRARKDINAAIKLK